MATGIAAAGLRDFSLVIGGPLFYVLRRTWLSGEGLELMRRRILALCALTWLPLLVLAVWEGSAWGAAATLPFLLDAEVHVRFLVALPLLLAAELVVHRRMQPVVRQFVERGLIPDPELERFDAALALGDAPAQLDRRGDGPVRDRLRVRGDGPVAPVHGPRRPELVRRHGQRAAAALGGGMVVRLHQPAPVPVPAAALVLPPVRVGPVPLAGLPHRAGPRAHPPRPRGRAGIPLPDGLRVHAAVAGPGRRCWPE